ncbi:hypothetical protein [Gluconobacter cerinus]|nr:hypothetical protein [Gluconobacter cerinus]
MSLKVLEELWTWLFQVMTASRYDYYCLRYSRFPEQPRNMVMFL